MANTNNSDNDYLELDDIKNNKGVKIVHLNIRSILPKFTLLKESFLDDSFDVVMLSETWMQQSIPSNLIGVSDYNLVRKDRQINKRGGGLCIYLRDNIVYEQLLPLLEGCDKDLEWLCLKISLGGHKKQIMLLLYRPPNGNPQQAISYLRACLEFFQSEHRNCELTIMGDLNIKYNNNRCPYVKSIKLLETLFETVNSGTH